MYRRINCLALFVMVFTACVSTGKMDGWLSSPRQAMGHVVFDYQTDVSGSGGAINAVLPDGETYSGNYMQITASTAEENLSSFFSDWDSYWSSWGPFGEPWYSENNYRAFRTNYTDKAIAALSSDRGKKMRCRFNLNDPPRGLIGGGTGQCQLSTGNTIMVQFG